MHKPIMACVAVVGFGVAFAGLAQAQQPAVSMPQQALKRDMLQTFDVPGTGYETRIGTSELGPNERSGRQSHPGPEGGYVLAGSGTVKVDGQPPMAVKAGQSYKLAAGAVHDVQSGPDGVTLLVTWVVRKGQPLATPAR